MTSDMTKRDVSQSKALKIRFRKRKTNNTSEPFTYKYNMLSDCRLYDKVLDRFTEIYLEQIESQTDQLINNIEFDIYDSSAIRTKNGDIRPHFVIPLDHKASITYDTNQITIYRNIVGTEHGTSDGVAILTRATLSCVNKKSLDSLIMECSDAKDKGIYTFSSCFGAWFKQSTQRPRDIKSIAVGDIEKQILDDFNIFNRSEDEYKKYNEIHKRTYMFTGSPGTGKSTMVKILATIMKCDIYYLSFSTELTDSTLDIAIKNLPHNTKYILLLEDLDCAFADRSTDLQKSKVSHSAIYNILDGVKTTDSVVTIITTNYPEKLDKTLIRPGRVDMAIQFKNVDKTQLRDLLQLHQRELSKSIFAKFLAICESYHIGASAVTNFLFRNRHMDIKDFDSTCCDLFKKYLDEMRLTTYVPPSDLSHIYN
jgi:hypothetical protein